MNDFAFADPAGRSNVLFYAVNAFGFVREVSSVMQDITALVAGIVTPVLFVGFAYSYVPRENVKVALGTVYVEPTSPVNVAVVANDIDGYVTAGAFVSA